MFEQGLQSPLITLLDGKGILEVGIASDWGPFLTGRSHEEISLPETDSMEVL